MKNEKIRSLRTFRERFAQFVRSLARSIHKSFWIAIDFDSPAAFFNFFIHFSLSTAEFSVWSIHCRCEVNSIWCFYLTLFLCIFGRSVVQQFFRFDLLFLLRSFPFGIFHSVLIMLFVLHAESMTFAACGIQTKHKQKPIYPNSKVETMENWKRAQSKRQTILKRKSCVLCLCVWNRPKWKCPLFRWVFCLWVETRKKQSNKYKLEHRDESLKKL